MQKKQRGVRYAKGIKIQRVQRWSINANKAKGGNNGKGTKGANCTKSIKNAKNAPGSKCVKKCKDYKA